jgi:hypothetical protein
LIDAVRQGHVPCRIMRSRRAGWRKSVCAIIVTRPTIFGNPFQVDRFGHKVAVLMFREWTRFNLGAQFLERRGFCPAEIDALGRRRVHLLSRLHELACHDLACWCPLTSPCHADTLLELAPVYAEYERLVA